MNDGGGQLVLQETDYQKLVGGDSGQTAGEKREEGGEGEGDEREGKGNRPKEKEWR